MPKVKVNDITINYEQQGSGEPLVLIPYLAADNDWFLRPAEEILAALVGREVLGDRQREPALA